MPLPSAMPITQHQLAAAVLAADHIVDRRAIAAFVADAATQPAPNPFPNTSAGAVRQVWQQRSRRVPVVRHPGGGPRLSAHGPVEHECG